MRNIGEDDPQLLGGGVDIYPHPPGFALIHAQTLLF